jgi:photosystem II stability/assembly factor-like uncharacterized protein
VLDGTTAGILYVASREGVYKSTDGGASWKALNKGLATLNIRSLVQSPTDSQVLYVGTNGSGLYCSRDGGETWEAMAPIGSGT